MTECLKPRWRKWTAETYNVGIVRTVIYLIPFLVARYENGGGAKD